MWKLSDFLYPKQKTIYIKEEVQKMIDESFEINWLKSMQKLDIKDGYIIVVKYPYCKLNTDTTMNLSLAIETTIKKFGVNIHVMILDNGTEFGILRKE